jgi:hypothetical protein
MWLHQATKPPNTFGGLLRTEAPFPRFPAAGSADRDRLPEARRRVFQSTRSLP